MNENKAESNVMMLVEGYPRSGFKAFSSMISDGTSSLCISRLHPEYVVEKYGLIGPRFYWLTGNKVDGAISPKSLYPIIKTIKQECKNKKLVVFFDGLEYLLLWNDVKKVMAALGSIGKALEINGGKIFICIDPLTFEQKDLDRIWSLFPRIVAAEVIKEQAQRTAPAGLESAARAISDPAAPKGLTASP